MPPASGEGGVCPHTPVDTRGGGPCPRAWGRLSVPHTQPFGPQLAEIHGVPRGLYDGPVHEVMAPTKPGAGAQARASCPGKISVPPFRNLHQSGFSLSGEWGLGPEGRVQPPALASHVRCPRNGAGGLRGSPVAASSSLCFQGRGCGFAGRH